MHKQEWRSVRTHKWQRTDGSPWEANSILWVPWPWRLFWGIITCLSSDSKVTPRRPLKMVAVVGSHLWYSCQWKKVQDESPHYLHYNNITDCSVLHWWHTRDFLCMDSMNLWNGLGPSKSVLCAQTSISSPGMQREVSHDTDCLPYFATDPCPSIWGGHIPTSQ